MLTPYNGLTNYISQLDDLPNDVGGLTADQLKAMFDKFGTEFVAWFNATHLGEVAGKSQLSNPNLLNNPFFQVNQRGQSSYNTIGYTVDMWKLGGKGALSVGSGYITLSGSGGYVYIDNIIENGVTSLVGKTLTVSAKLPDGTIIQSSGVYNAVSSLTLIFSANFPNSLGWVGLVANSTSLFVRIRAENTKSVNLVAIKLELGSISTLANDAPPKIATDLAECQRYYLQGSSLVCAGTTTGSNTFVICSIPTPVTMRTIPTLTYGACHIRIGGKLISNAALGALSVQPNSVRAAFTLPAAEAVHTPVSVEFVDFKLSAEIL